MCLFSLQMSVPIVVSELDYLQVSGCLSLMGRSKPKVTGWSRLTAQTFLRKQLSTQHKTHLFRPRLDFSLCAPLPVRGWQCCPFHFFPSSPQMRLRTQAPGCSASAQGRLGSSQKKTQKPQHRFSLSTQTRNPKLVSPRFADEQQFEVCLCRQVRSELPIHY